MTSSLALPLRLEGCQIIDATGASIALLRGGMAEYRAHGAEIVAAVNTFAKLLAAAKGALDRLENFTGSYDTPEESARRALKAAIAAAEEPTP